MDNVGWTCAHPHYGEWFVPVEAVIENWKQDQRDAYPDFDEREPDDETIETWFHEQISWIEVSQIGTQTKRPDMDAIEKIWLENMKQDPSYIDAAIANCKEQK